MTNTRETPEVNVVSTVAYGPNVVDFVFGTFQFPEK